MKDISLVICSNQINNNKLNIDMIKRKLEAFLAEYKIPVLAIFAMQPNRMSKPHTGQYAFLKMYYKTKGACQLGKAIVVSDFGGRLMDKSKKNGTVTVTADRTDVDRAFAHNIGAPFYTIREFSDSIKQEKFVWNTHILSPELRIEYIEKMSAYKNPNIFVKLSELPVTDQYMIIIYGAPRCGKTTLSKELVKKWAASDYGKTHAIRRLGLDEYGNKKRIGTARKMLTDHITVIIDGGCFTGDSRKPYEELCAELNTSVLYIEVNPSIGFAYIFNHVAVETAKTEDINLLSIKDYYYYKSKMTRPPNVLKYCPEIKTNTEVMTFRY